MNKPIIQLTPRRGSVKRADLQLCSRLLREHSPKEMVVAIDGWAQSGKNTIGSMVAEELDAVLIDSGRFYRALTKACLEAGVELGDQSVVTQFCCSAFIEVRFRKESGLSPEAQVSVNGRWFTPDELNSVGVEVCEVSKLQLVRVRINETLRLCADEGRIVMLGRDIATNVFPATPFAFFLDAPKHIRERRQKCALGRTDAIARDQQDAQHLSIRPGMTVIDTHKLTSQRCVWTILNTLFELMPRTNA